MKKRIINLSILIVLLFNGIHLFGQVGISISNPIYQSTSLTFGDTVKVSFRLTNGDTIDYVNRSCIYQIYVNDSLENNYITSVPILNILKGDSVRVALSFPISNGPAFKSGPNVVIIWPSIGRPALDSINKIINITPLSIFDNKNLTFNLNFSNQSLKIGFSNNKNTIESVRIYNINGQIVLDELVSNRSSIPFENKPYGIYFVELTLANKKRTVIKLPYFE